MANRHEAYLEIWLQVQEAVRDWDGDKSRWQLDTDKRMKKAYQAVLKDIQRKIDQSNRNIEKYYKALEKK